MSKTTFPQRVVQRTFWVHWLSVLLLINLPPCLEDLQAIWNGTTNSDMLKSANLKSQKDLTAMILIILLITHDEFMPINPEVAGSTIKNSEHMIQREYII